MGPRRKGRILAVQALFAYEFTRCPVAALTCFPWAATEKNPDDIRGPTRDFASLLTAGTIENLESVDALIAKHLVHWDFSRLNRVDLAILRVSVYSLLFMKDVPASVVIDEAVSIAKDYGTDESYKFINGVLDGARKNLEKNHESA